MLRVFLLDCVGILAAAAVAFAGMNPDAKVAVHVAPHASRSCTKNLPMISDCNDIITTDPGISVDVFPVFYDLVEYQGFEYSMTFVSGYSCMFTSCSDLTVGDIVFSGDGISHTWNACQHQSVAICGFGWLYSYGMVSISAHPTAGGPDVRDCHGGRDDLTISIRAGTNGLVGDEPCDPG